MQSHPLIFCITFCISIGLIFFPLNPQYTFRSVPHISAYDVFSAYNEKDPIAISVLHKAVEMWGMASANLVSLLNPQKIIWGGGVFGPAGIFIDDIYKEACKWAQPLSIKQVEFVPSQLSGNAGLIGAAFLAIKNHLYE